MVDSFNLPRISIHSESTIHSFIHSFHKYLQNTFLHARHSLGLKYTLLSKSIKILAFKKAIDQKENLSSYLNKYKSKKACTVRKDARYYKSMCCIENEKEIVFALKKVTV